MPQNLIKLQFSDLLSLYLSAAHRTADFCYHFFNPEATGQTKMIAKIVKGDQLTKNICYHFCVGQFAGAIQNDSIPA
ncbi:hypothetical protein I8284_003219 [Proteus mirabilis]|nr:hypothetical protein [Proteus mirabilis]